MEFNKIVLNCNSLKLTEAWFSRPKLSVFLLVVLSTKLQ